MGDRVHDMSLDEIFHSEPMKKLRQDLLSEVKNPACQVCWDAEEKGIESYRFASDPVGFNLEADPLKPMLGGVDMTFGENCNLRCRMCTPGQSNKLRIDDKFFRENKTPGRPFYLPGWNDKYNTDPSAVNFFSETSPPFLDLLAPHPTVRFLRATGGETLRTRGFEMFLDNAIDKGIAGEITLAYHTNAAKFTDEAVEKLRRFRANHPTFSIDSVGKNYEYIRHPMPWSMLEKSVDNYLAKVPTDFLLLNCAVSAMNLHYLTDLAEWAIEKLRPHLRPSPRPLLNVNFDPVWPVGRPIDFAWLPQAILAGQLAKLRDFKSRATEQWYCMVVDHLITSLESALQNRRSENDPLLLRQQKKMYLEITAFDQSREQSYRDFLHPEVVEFLDRVGTQIDADEAVALSQHP